MRQVRSTRYLEIAGELRGRASVMAAGALLPSEAELSREFDVSRVTVRRALEILREEGLVDARQGLGWFAVGSPLTQSLGRLGTIEEQMAATGRSSERRVLEFAFERATKRVAKLLGSEQVLRVKRVNTVDGVPIAVVVVWCPAELGRKLSRGDVEARSFYELIGVQLGGARQTISADVATKEQARLLDVPVGSAVLSCERVTSDVDGRVVLASHHVFPAHRTNFVVDLPSAAPSMAPTGLRLVGMEG